MKRIVLLILCSVLILLSVSCQSRKQTFDERIQLYAYVFQDKQSLTYQSTRKIPSLLIDETLTSFQPSERAYDIYVNNEKDGTEYLYFSGSTVQCGYIEPHVYGDGVSSKTSMEIMQTSLDLIRSITDRYSEYTLLSCEYSEQQHVFCVTFKDQIQGVDTDDTILMYFRGDGSLGAYTAYALGNYADCAIADDIPSIIRLYEKEQYETVTNTFITRYHSDYYLVIEGFADGSRVLQQSVVLLTEEKDEPS